MTGGIYSLLFESHLPPERKRHNRSGIFQDTQCITLLRASEWAWLMLCGSFFHCTRVRPEQIDVGAAMQSHWQSRANIQAHSDWSNNTPSCFYTYQRGQSDPLVEVNTLTLQQVASPGFWWHPFDMDTQAWLPLRTGSKKGGIKTGKMGRATKLRGSAAASSTTSPAVTPSGKGVSFPSQLGHRSLRSGGVTLFGNFPPHSALPLRETPVVVWS